MVRVMGRVDDEVLQRLREGVELDDGPARFSDIQEGGGDGINRFFYVVLMEGRNREVRRLWESQGLTVSRLKRVRYGEVFMPSKLKQGQWLEMSQKDVDVIYQMAGLPAREVASLSQREQVRHERLVGKNPRPRGGRGRRAS
jgi:23S rRNA pseudouridine2605 synthase